VGQVQEAIDDGHEELDALLEAFELETSGLLDADDLISAAQRQFARLSLDSALSLSGSGTADPSPHTLVTPARLRSTDTLTGLPNRRAVHTYLANRLALHRHTHATGDLGVLIVHVDRYPDLHSSLGAIAGDELIQALGRRIADSVETTDLTARFGVEQFLLVLPETTPPVLAEVAEQLRTRIGAEPFASSSADVNLTVSVGGTMLAGQETPSPEQLLTAAEVELDRSLAAGGNRASVQLVG
jgi:diguanylate cyclase (GGDEF)-like protein